MLLGERAYQRQNVQREPYREPLLALWRMFHIAILSPYRIYGKRTRPLAQATTPTRTP
jgi:hypothetical protein